MPSKRTVFGRGAAVWRRPTRLRCGARRLFDTGRYAGVDAYKVTSDPQLGEYDEPVFLVRLGSRFPGRRSRGRTL